MWKFFFLFVIFLAESAVIEEVKDVALKCEFSNFNASTQEYIEYIDCSLTDVSSPKDRLKVTSNTLYWNTVKEINKTIYVDIVGNDNYPEYLPEGLGRSINGTGGFTYKNSPLKYIKRADFKDMAPSLFLIILEDNKIEEIPHDTFYDLPYFHYLDVRRNKIKSLVPNLFDHAPDFSTLIIEENQVTELHVDLFKNCPDFHVLYAEFNEISEIHEDLFKNNPNMSIISMRHNKIKNVPIDFKKYNELSVADFTHNGGKCDTMYFSFQPYVEYYDENEQKKWIKTVTEFQHKIEEICRE